MDEIAPAQYLGLISRCVHREGYNATEMGIAKEDPHAYRLKLGRISEMNCRSAVEKPDLICGTIGHNKWTPPLPRRFAAALLKIEGTWTRRIACRECPFEILSFDLLEGPVGGCLTELAPQI